MPSPRCLDGPRELNLSPAFPLSEFSSLSLSFLTYEVFFVKLPRGGNEGPSPTSPGPRPLLSEPRPRPPNPAHLIAPSSTPSSGSAFTCPTPDQQAPPLPAAPLARSLPDHAHQATPLLPRSRSLHLGGAESRRDAPH